MTIASVSEARIIEIGGIPCIAAANLQFERIVDEFVRWREVPEDERSPAPGLVVGTGIRGSRPAKRAAGRIVRAAWDWLKAPPTPRARGFF